MSPDSVDKRIEESVVVLDANGVGLVAVLTRSTGRSGGPSIVLCPGGWYGTATNRNRVFVRVARRLAASGARVIRFDWHGVGESAGEIDRYVLDEPFADDVVAAAGFFADDGDRGVVLVGVCFGARSALAAAPYVPRLAQLILLSFPVPNPEGLTKASWYGRHHGTRDLLRLTTDRAVLTGLLDPNVRRVYRKAARMKLRAIRKPRSSRAAGGREGASAQTRLTPRELLRQLEELDGRGVRTHLIFGEEDLELAAFKEFREGALDSYLTADNSSTSVRTVPGNIHGFDTLALQENVIDLVSAEVLPASDG
jgi:pimeloyl-ACP methyl ester carboxylesterase